jgi:peptide chain release factor 1
MLEKLAEIAAKFELLDQQMQDPSVINDPKQYQQIAREHGSLKELVGTYRRYQALEQQIADNKALLQEADAELKELAQAELPELETERADLAQQLELLLLPKDPNDDKDIILEIRAGTGGDEAALFVADLLRMYQRYCDNRGWKLAVMDSNETGGGGFKEIVATISGDQVYSTFKFESGTHRVQRVPATESQGRVHTSAVTVAVLAEAEGVEFDIKSDDIEFEAFRASGAGGQHVNTTDSAVRITYKPTGLAVVCREERSQIKNRAKAMKLLKSRLLAAEQEKLAAERSADRKSMVGTGDRSEKIRTYNYPQNRVTDHRISLTLKKLDQVMNGAMEEIVTSLRTHHQAELLKESTHT